MAFPVTCPACGKAFQLATEIYERKVAGKVVSIKCKQCQAGIRVDATQPGELKVIGATPAGGGDLSVGPKPPEAKAALTAAEERPKPPPVRMRQPTLIGMMSPAVTGKAAAPAAPRAPAAAPAAAPAGASSTPALWAVDAGGTGDDRELNDDEIRREIMAGNLTGQTLAWREGMGEWLEIDKIPELRAFLATPPGDEPKPPPRAVEPMREVAPVKAQSAGFQDEPDAEATMVYDRSAPNAALEPFVAPEPAGLAPPAFAMTAPMGQPPPPPPLPAAGRPAPPPPAQPPPPARPAPPAERREPPPQAAPSPLPTAPPLPKPPAPAPQLAAVPWGDPLPSAKPASPGLPTAPYGPDPFAIAATTDLDFPSPRKKTPLVIAAVVGVVAVIGIIIAVASSGSAPVANIAPPPPAPTTPTTTESPKAEEPKPTNEPTPSDNQPRGTPGAQSPTQNGNFSDLFSKGAEKAKGSGGPATKGFDEAQARAALSEHLKAAAGCKEPGGPTGQTSATVTFDPNGSVAGVTVGAPFAGSSTGTCIITAFKRARVAPFTGLPGTVSQSISLR